jgi:LmbE family N-acetylglucosaminyl deacetylase
VAELVDAVPARALAIYAHPDDAEMSCGGTLARWAAAGAELHVCTCTLGDKGSSDPATDPAELAVRRRAEVRAAAKILGIAGEHHFDIPDGELEDTLELRGRLVALLRRLRPEVVVAPDPTAVLFGQHYLNHRDHRVAGWATLDAVSPAAGSPLYFPGAGRPHRVDTVYLSGTLEPNVWIDITASIETKVEALACHATQVGEPDEWLRSVVRERAEEAGRAARVAYAESFRRLLLQP